MLYSLRAGSTTGPSVKNDLVLLALRGNAAGLSAGAGSMHEAFCSDFVCVRPGVNGAYCTLVTDDREQLGGNKFLVSDGIFMAKALGRTFVEYPVKDAR